MAKKVITRGGIKHFLYNSIPVESREKAKEILSTLAPVSSYIVPSKEGYNIYIAENL